METTVTDFKTMEHLLAEKARAILDHQVALEKLEQEKRELEKQKPRADKEYLTFEESVEFLDQTKAFNNRLEAIKSKILKQKRELKALEIQAQKLLPVAGVKIKVSTKPDKSEEKESYCVQYVDEDNSLDSNSHFKIEPL